MSRKGDEEGRSLPYLAFKADAPSHRLDQLLGDAEAQTRTLRGPGRGSIRLRESLEDPVAEVLRYPRALVGDGDPYEPRFADHRDDHSSAHGRELGRVRQEMGQHLSESLWIGRDLRILVQTFQVQGHPGEGRLRAMRFYDPLDRDEDGDWR